MEFQRFGEHYVLKLEPDEEVMETLLDFAAKEEIGAGYFVAFGAFSRVVLRYFDVGSKSYRDHVVDQQVEVVSLMGNIAHVNGKPMIHMHTSVADGQSRTFSGHIGEGTVRPTLEVFLTRLPGQLRRAKDPATGLELLDLPRSVQPAEPGERAA